MATNIDIRKVKIRKMGNACLLKKSVQQLIVRETAIRLTDRIIMAAGFMKIDLKAGLLYPMYPTKVVKRSWRLSII